MDLRNAKFQMRTCTRNVSETRSGSSQNCHVRSSHVRAHRKLLCSGRDCERHAPLGNICTSHLQRVRRQRRRPRRRLRWQAPAAAALPRTFSLTSKAFLNRRNSYHSVELLPTGGPVAEFVVHGVPAPVLFAVEPLAEYAFLGPRLTPASLAGMIGRQFI